MEDAADQPALGAVHEDRERSWQGEELAKYSAAQQLDLEEDDEDAASVVEKFNEDHEGEAESTHGDSAPPCDDEPVSDVFADAASTFQGGESVVGGMSHAHSGLVSLGPGSDDEAPEAAVETAVANQGLARSSLLHAPSLGTGAPSSTAVPAHLTSSQADLQRLDHAMGHVSLAAGTRTSGSSPGVAGAVWQAASDSRDKGETDIDVSWSQHGKHFFVLTASGRPVWTYHGDEDALAGLMALITALVSVIQDQGDAVQHVVSGRTLIVFLVRGPLILVATSRLGEPLIALAAQLRLLHRQIQVIVTTGLEKILNRNPSYDARTLLEGVGDVLRTLVARIRLDAAYLMGGPAVVVAPLMPVPVPGPDRALATHALNEAVKSSGALYGLLLTSGGGALATARSSLKGLAPLSGADVLLLDTFVACSPAIRHGGGEAFCPICMPAFSPSAFLHAYILYLDPGGRASSQQQPVESSLYLVLLAATSDSFHALSKAREVIEETLSRGSHLAHLRAAAAAAAGQATGGAPAADAAVAALVSAQQAAGPTSPTGSPPSPAIGAISVEGLPRPLGGKLGTTPLWHFMAHFTQRQQLVRAAFTEPFHTSTGRQQLCAAYAQLHACVWDCPDGARPNKLVWLATERLALLALSDADMELYVVLDPLAEQAAALRLADALRRYLLAASRAGPQAAPGVPQILLPLHI